MSSSVSKDLRGLLRERSVEIGEFRLSSGGQSSFYIDARRTTMSAAGLELVGRGCLETLRARSWKARFVGGLTLGADPVAYAIALASRSSPPEIDAFTIRKHAKQHGLGREIEGCFEAGAPVVVVEDVLTTGRSALTAIAAVERAAGDVVGVLALVERDEGGREAVEAAGFELASVVTLADLGLV